MKTIEQLLSLLSNPYYQLSEEEQTRLDAFLLKKSEQRNLQKPSSDKSGKNTRATVLNKNIFKKEIGEIPTINNVVTEEDVK